MGGRSIPSLPVSNGYTEMLESELNASDQDPLLFPNIYDRFYLVQSSYELVAVTIGPGGVNSFQYVTILLFVWTAFCGYYISIIV